MDEKLEINVALVSDFYYPAVGGVELQIAELAKYLKTRVNRVIVITHCVAQPPFFGRQAVGDVTTYYLPWHYSSSNVIYPTFILEYPEAKGILREQKIDLVHVHQSSSVLGICYGIFGYHLGLRVVHTEHSLYGFRSMAEMCFCWTITPVFELYDRLICVSRATRNNLILRCRTTSRKTIVIPNAVMAPTLGPFDRQLKDTNKIRIIVVSRMVYRRGIDVLIPLLPKLCQRNPQIVIEMVGDGPKLKPLREMVKQKQLQGRIILHGGKANSETLSIIKQCHIFLSTALTESFGIALVEAASLGLHVVSTNVGGVSEILPPSQLHAVELVQAKIIQKLEEIIGLIGQRKAENNQNTHGMYLKQECFERVIDVYKEVMELPRRSHVIKTAKNVFAKGSLPSLALLLILFVLSVIDVFTKPRQNPHEE